MSEARLVAAPVTIADFEAFRDARQDDALWRLVAGRIVAMTNPTEDHEQIASNIGAPLKLAMDAIGCRVYQGGIGVQPSDSSEGTDRTRPDVFVRCGRSGGRNFITDPLVVVEVLSPSTMDVDRGVKLQFYKAQPALRHVVLVYQDQMRAEHYLRMDTDWELEVLTEPEEMLSFEAVPFSLATHQVYFGVDISNVRRLAR